MSIPPPSVVILHGEDEFGIAQDVARMEQEMGEPSIASLNITRMDGRSLSLDQLTNAARAIPFMASRRLVIVTQASQRLSHAAQREALIKLLETLPESTLLVLVEYQALAENHWIMEWAKQAGLKVSIRMYSPKKGEAMANWIEEEAKGMGGRFSHPAASVLASLVGDDCRVAHQEIEKLLTYARGKQIQPEDVRELSAFTGEVSIFTLVDGLGQQDSKKASGAVRRLLEEQDPLQIFSMVTRQIRLLIMTHEIVNSGGRLGDVMKRLHLAEFQAKKLMAQARHFSLETLEQVYRKLLDLDDGIKTGLYDEDTALETFVLAFTQRSESRSH